MTYILQRQGKVLFS